MSAGVDAGHDVAAAVLLDAAAVATAPGRRVDDGGSAVVRRRPLTTNPYQRELRHFIDGLRSGEPFLTSGEDGQAAVALACAILTSMRTGQPVHLTSPATAIA